MDGINPPGETAIAEITTIIKNALQKSPQGETEYNLLKSLEAHSCFQELLGSGDLLLFRRHFLLKHCLYRLQEQLWREGEGVLSIGLLKISLTIPKDDGDKDVGEAVAPSLKAYYLDWNNFESNEEEVDALLNSFWQDYAKYIQQDDAWEILGVPVGSNQSAITIRYRELAATHHPDKGGDKDMFIKIRAAYEVLKTGF